MGQAMDRQPIVQIREVRLDDARALLDLKLALDHETTYMMFEPGERPTDPDATAFDIRSVLASDNSTIIVADASGELAGYIEARGGEFRRNRHSAVLIAGVRQAYAGRGIGSRLFEALLAWAESLGLVRLELTVMTHNEAAIGLYRKYGFEIEGARRASMLVEGNFQDEYFMARLAPGSFAAPEPNG
jgi:RimJ/RimL family protein N-acetyltransferase